MLSRVNFLILGLSAILLAANPTYALNIKHHEINWITALGLTKTQQQQIFAIENDYRNKQQALRENTEHCINPAALKAQLEELDREFFKEMQGILTAEQQLKANDISRQQFRKIQLRYAHNLANELAMPDEQKQTLLEVVQLVNFQYQWPVNLHQRQQSQTELENTVNQFLTSEQKQQWQQMNNSPINKWRQYNDYESPCTKNLDQLS